MSAVVEDGLLPAWDDSVHSSQAAFRSVLKALSEPGTVQKLPDVSSPAPLAPATAALCLALADFETPVWLDALARTSAVSSYLRFHCGCALSVEPSAAVFAVITDSSNLSLHLFAQGLTEYPDRSATLLVQVPTLTDGPRRIVQGPGIRDARPLCVGELPADFDQQWLGNGTAFPLGVDIIFCCGNHIVGLPRTTRIVPEASSCM